MLTLKIIFLVPALNQDYHFQIIKKLLTHIILIITKLIKNNEIEKNLAEIFNNDNPCIIGIICKIEVRYPKLGAIKNEDGTFTGQPYENMVPFLDKEELENEMII